MLKRLGVLVIFALGGCQTSGEVDTVSSPAAAPGGESCARSRMLLDRYYLTPHQRSDLIETMRANGCRASARHGAGTCADPHSAERAQGHVAS